MGKVLENEKVGILVISFICNPITYYNYKYMYVFTEDNDEETVMLLGVF